MRPELHGESLISPIDPTSPSANGPRHASNSSTVSAVTVTGGQNAARRRSSEGRVRNDSAAAAAAGQGMLSVVAEDTKLIGHYGPSDRMAGQTAAGLNQRDGNQDRQNQSGQYHGGP
ncbi:hypothetical protein FALCPG4_008645 [Fusarium falciforme]